MLQILFILMSTQFGWAQQSSPGQQNSPQLCEAAMKKVYEGLTPQCKWVQYPEDHPWSNYCHISCEQNDQYLQQRYDPQTQSEKEAKLDTKFFGRIEKASCQAGAEACSKDPQKCFEYQKKDDIEACAELKADDPWHLDPGAPLPAGTKNYNPLQSNPPPK